MAVIVQTNVISDNDGNPGLIIAEHIFDDGEVWPAIFELLKGEDIAKRLDAMIPAREAERAANDAAKADAAILNAAQAKLDAYVAVTDAKTLTATIGLTDDEAAKLKESTADVVAVAAVADVAIIP